MCKRFERLKTKDSMKIVVRINCRRGAATTTRSEGLVVETVGSCLGRYIDVGMNDRADGSKD